LKAIDPAIGADRTVVAVTKIDADIPAKDNILRAEKLACTKGKSAPGAPRRR
jgi:hypothetical protein